MTRAKTQSALRKNQLSFRAEREILLSSLAALVLSAVEGIGLTSFGSSPCGLGIVT